MSKQTLAAMPKRSIRTRLIRTAAVVAALACAVAAFAQSGQTSFGTAITLPGQINDIAVDEARGLVYAGNFSAGRVEVVSMDTSSRISSFSTSPQPSAMSGMAVSPNGQWLVATNLPVTVGVPQLSGVTVVNLNDPSDRRTHAFQEEPLGVTFGADNLAVVITKQSLQIFNPADGSFRELFRFESPSGGDVVLPVTPPTLPRQIVSAHIAASADGRWIFGVTSDFVFSYQVRQPVGLLTIRAIDTFVNPPSFSQVSAGKDGSYFMAGQLLLTNDLRVIADSPEAPENNADFIGGTGVDSEIDTVYAAFDAPGLVDSALHPVRGVLQVMEADNLHVKQRLRLTERIVGPIVPGGNGRYLYAVSEGGLLSLPLEDLPQLPQLEVNPADRSLFFQFDFCNREALSKTIRIDSPPGGAPARFSLSVEPFRSSGRPAILFEPHQGVTPAVVKVTVDPGSLGPVQGTNSIPINIETDAVNIPQTSLVISNVRDVDQKGTLIPTPGHLINIVGDPYRDRFYALDDENFRVVAFDSNERRQIGEFRVGNTPRWMTMSRDGRYLVVANGRSESVTYIDLNQMVVAGPVYMPWQLLQAGHYPISLATGNNSIIVAVQTSNGDSRLDTLNVASRSVSSRETLGIYANSFGPSLAVASHPDGNFVLAADSSGTTALWEASSNRLIAARKDFSGLSGTLGGGPNYFVAGSNVLNMSLVPIGTFADGTASQTTSGFTVLSDGTGVRSIRPIGAVDSGAVQKLDPRDPTILFGSARLSDPPSAQAGDQAFSDTLATLRDGRLVSTTSAGVIELPAAFDTGRDLPRIEAVTNAADFSPLAAPGGLISVFGERLSEVTTGAVDAPLPTKLGDVCVSANGAILPLLYVSPNQINAQMDFGSIGPTDVQVHTQSGTSDVFVQQIDTAAPAIFGIRGPDSRRYAAIFRENNTLATISNALRPNEIAVVYLTGLGQVAPLAVTGEAASKTILTETIEPVTVSFGGVNADIIFSGLTPGFVGLYQLNLKLPSFVPLGEQVPMTISAGSNSTTVNVRIVKE